MYSVRFLSYRVRPTTRAMQRLPKPNLDTTETLHAIPADADIAAQLGAIVADSTFGTTRYLQCNRHVDGYDWLTCIEIRLT